MARKNTKAVNAKTYVTNSTTETSFDLTYESQLKLITLSARPKPAKETKLDDCLADLPQSSNFKIVQVKHLRCCYNILAALQEFYDCNFSFPLWFAKRLYKSNVPAVMVKNLWRLGSL